jgi:hypothetical protein
MNRLELLVADGLQQTSVIQLAKARLSPPQYRLSHRLCERVSVLDDYLRTIQPLEVLSQKVEEVVGLEEALQVTVPLLHEIHDKSVSPYLQEGSSTFDFTTKMLFNADYRDKEIEQWRSLNHRLQRCLVTLLPDLEVDMAKQYRDDCQDLQSAMEAMLDEAMEGLIIRLATQSQRPNDLQELVKELLKHGRSAGVGAEEESEIVRCLSVLERILSAVSVRDIGAIEEAIESISLKVMTSFESHIQEFMTLW